MEDFLGLVTIEAVGFKSLNKNMIGREVGWFKLKTSFLDHPMLLGANPISIAILIKCWSLQAQNNGEAFTISSKSLSKSIMGDKFTPKKYKLVTLLLVELEQNQLLKLKWHLIDREIERKNDSKSTDSMHQGEILTARLTMSPLINEIEKSLCELFRIEKLDRSTKYKLPAIAAYYKTFEDFEVSVNEILKSDAAGKIYESGDDVRLKKYVMISLYKQIGVMS